MAEPKRIGVVGCGLIAQVMHLPYLAQLSDRFEIAALCDVSPRVLAACSERYGVDATFERWEDLVAQPLDAVLVLTSGDHGPIAVRAAQQGRHVFVEKPMAYTPAEGVEMIAAAERAGVRLMVGTMKRYDPAVERLAELLADGDDLRLVRVTTLEAPLEPYVAHYPLVRPTDLAEDAASLGAGEAAIAAALDGADEELRWCYRSILLDNLVHELNLLRGLLGEPARVTHARLDRRHTSVGLEFGAAACQLDWVDLPGIARYSQELAFYAPGRRLTLGFPSPFLRSMPTSLVVEGGRSGTPTSWRTEELVSYEEAFERELVEFHDCIVSGREPRTSGRDGLRDLALCASIVRAHVSREPVERPSEAVVAAELPAS